jgi:hypothetical protein
MSVRQILHGLERSDATGADADAVARLGFLEWAFALPGAATPEAARAALAAAQPEPRSPAAQAFVQFLSQATMRVPDRTRRGRAMRVH